MYTPFACKRVFYGKTNRNLLNKDRICIIKSAGKEENLKFIK